MDGQDQAPVFDPDTKGNQWKNLNGLQGLRVGAQRGRTASALRYRQSLVTGNGQGWGLGGTLEEQLSGPCHEAGLSVRAGFQPVGRDWKLTFKSG